MPREKSRGELIAMRARNQGGRALALDRPDGDGLASLKREVARMERRVAEAMKPMIETAVRDAIQDVIESLGAQQGEAAKAMAIILGRQTKQQRRLMLQMGGALAKAVTDRPAESIGLEIIPHRGPDRLVTYWQMAEPGTYAKAQRKAEELR